MSLEVSLILIQARRSLAKAKTQSAWERVCTMLWQAATFRLTFCFLFLLYVCFFGGSVSLWEQIFLQISSWKAISKIWTELALN